MIIMLNFKVLSLDMFQTLVNIESRVPYIWKQILQENYALDLATKYRNDLMSIFLSYFHERSKKDEFITIKSMFEYSFNRLFKEVELNINSELAADIITREHGNASLFDDTKIFLDSIKGKVPVCLVSDADDKMILPLLDRFEFDNVFISEQIKAYKSHKEGKIFKELINKYEVEPEDILHIGDGYSDIVGAKRIGIKTCWINREKRSWDYDIKPDYSVEKLTDILSILVWI